jgi:hypothetical protein
MIVLPSVCVLARGQEPKRVSTMITGTKISIEICPRQHIYMLKKWFLRTFHAAAADVAPNKPEFEG